MQAREGSAVQEGFSEIRNAADRAAALTHQLLAYSGRQFVRSSPISAASWLSALGSSLRARWPDRVVVETKTPDDWVLNGDPLHLDALFRELVANGLDAMGDRGTVVVSGGVADKATPEQAVVLPVPPGRCLAIAVSDSGCGIPPESRLAIFDPFFTTKPVHAAAGLGLASVYGIATAHQAGLTVESMPGRGTTMTVYLPVSVSGDLAAQA
jgi:signal transduction histidine kinase